jgi:NAD dependent epimerase/dehydratase
MSNEPLRVGVTGAGGFIGSHLVEELLRAGHRVRALRHYNAYATESNLELTRRAVTPEQAERLEVLFGDITDARSVRHFVEGCDTVFHLAALIAIPYSYSAPQSYVATNVIGTMNVLEACRDLGNVRLVHTSTSEVYGSARTTPMDEGHPLQAQSPYAASKIAADKMVESYHLSYGLPAITVRPFNAYGPRQSMRAVLPTIIAQALAKKVEAIRLGATDPVRDLTYVEDVARAFRQVAEAPRDVTNGRTYNLGTGSGISIGKLAQLVLDVLKIEKPIVADETRLRPSASEVRVLISNNNKVRREVGWAPSITLEEGITRTADFIKRRLDRINPEVYTR